MTHSRFLLTGASGFIGQAVSAELIRRGFPVRRISRQSGSPPPQGDHATITSIGPDTDWTESLQDIDVVIHLAARVHVMHESPQDAATKHRLVNTLGTLQLARQAASAGVRRFVFMSSIKVNGESTPIDRPFTEADPPCPTDPYGLSKQEAEQGLVQIGRDSGMEITVIRPPLVYGPGVKANFAALANAVMRERWLPLGSIDNRRSLVALDNLVDFTVHCAMHPAAAHQIFLVSDGHDLSTPDLISGMARAAGVRPRLLPVPPWALLSAGSLFGRRAAMRRLCESLCVDITKARRLLGWSPPITVDAGLGQVMQSYTCP